MGTILGVLAILAGGSSSESGSFLDGIGVALAVAIYMIAIYMYWAFASIGLTYACDYVGVPHGISIFIVLLGPIAFPMLAIELSGKK